MKRFVKVIKCCFDCPNYYYGKCSLSKKQIDDHYRIPDWCQLDNEPERRDQIALAIEITTATILIILFVTYILPKLQSALT